MRRSVVFVALGFFLVAGVALAATALDQRILDKFAEQEKQYQLPSGILAKIAWVESKNNISARAQTSSATGLFQWLNNSWLSATKQLYGRPKEPGERTNPFISAEVTAFALAQTRAQVGGLIKQAGIDETVGLYMGHFLGPGGAKKFLQGMIANPGAPAVSGVGADQAAANRSIFYNGATPRSFSQVVNLFAEKLKSPGVKEFSNYQGTYADSSLAGRIMDTQGAAGLARSYTGPMPPPDPNYDYSAPLSQQQCQPRQYCSSNTVLARDGMCSIFVLETCQYGCSEGACLTPSMQQRCPDGSVPVYGQCPQQQCPAGLQRQYANGPCVPIPNYQQQQQYQQLPQSQQPLPAQIGGTTGASPSTATQSTPQQSFSSIGEYLTPKTGDIGNTASGFDSKAFDLLSFRDNAALAPVAASGTDTVGFGVGSMTPGGLVPGQGQAGIDPVTGQTTFTSPDLKDLPPVSPAVGDRSPGFVNRVLSTLREALLKAYDFLVSLRVRLTQER